MVFISIEDLYRSHVSRKGLRKITEHCGKKKKSASVIRTCWRRGIKKGTNRLLDQRAEDSTDKSQIMLIYHIINHYETTYYSWYPKKKKKPKTKNLLS